LCFMTTSIGWLGGRLGEAARLPRRLGQSTAAPASGPRREPRYSRPGGGLRRIDVREHQELRRIPRPPDERWRAAEPRSPCGRWNGSPGPGELAPQAAPAACKASWSLTPTMVLTPGSSIVTP